MKNIVQNILMITCIAVFGLSAYKLYGIWHEYHAGDKIYEGVLENVIVEADPENAEESSKDDETDETDHLQDALSTDEAKVHVLTIDLAELKQINQDAIGWIQIPDTSISYPILQAEDNDTYIRNTITGEDNKAGSIFVDCNIQHPFEDTNTIVYGHNLLNGKMFSDLMKYEKQSWYELHPLIYITTEKGIQTWKVYSCFRTSAYSDVYTIGMESGTENYSDYLMKSVEQAIYETGIVPEGDSRVITLSTCTNETDEERFVVMAVPVE